MPSLILALHAKNRTKGKWKINGKENRKEMRNEKKLSLLPAILTNYSKCIRWRRKISGEKS